MPLTAAQDAIATADSYLQNAVLPTYSELLQALREVSATIDNSNKMAPESVGRVLSQHRKTMAGNFGG
jgi:hypothetical protein